MIEGEKKKARSSIGLRLGYLRHRACTYTRIPHTTHARHTHDTHHTTSGPWHRIEAGLLGFPPPGLWIRFWDLFGLKRSAKHNIMVFPRLVFVHARRRGRYATLTFFNLLFFGAVVLCWSISIRAVCAS